MILKKKAKKQGAADDLRPEYDFAALKNGVRDKYAARFRAGTNLVLLSPDVAKYFSDEQSVNAALRTLIDATKRPRRRRTPEHDQRAPALVYLAVSGRAAYGASCSVIFDLSPTTTMVICSGLMYFAVMRCASSGVTAFTLCT